MPRPKLLPGQRRRAAEACNFCRSSKKRCSATVPCTACQRRGIAASCYLTYQPRGSRRALAHGDKAARVLDPPPPPPPAESSPTGPGDADPTIGPDLANDQVLDAIGITSAAEVDLRADRATPISGEGHQPVAPSESPVGVSESGRSCPRPVGPEAHGRMLLNRQGERVYIGRAASLSFLQFIRETVASQIGPSQFSHNDKSDSMLETESAVNPSMSPASSHIGHGVADCLMYAHIFQTATAGLLNVFPSSEMEEILLQARTDGARFMSPCRKATADLIVAIGAQCKSPTDAQQVGLVYFRHAQHAAFAGMLEDPNVDMVRAFLLMSFYLLGQCRRNAAFMYLGIAARAAVALGMHTRASYTDMKSLAHRHRLHVWMSLCIMDMLVSSILGRPPATSGLRSELESSLIDSPLKDASRHEDNITWLFASYRILSIVNESIEMLYGKKMASTLLVERFLNKIGDWSGRLPEILRRPPQGVSKSTQERMTIGSIHVSCLYYFSVTLVTRPILIAVLTSQTTARTASPSSPQASACLDAAVYLAQTCADAHKAGLLLGNMCIMKALVFAAGLVLGFNMFAKKEMDYEVESAFGSAKEVLDFLALQSPQAAHYHEILTLLSNAITAQRKKQAARPRNTYVGRLFTLGGERDSRQGEAAEVTTTQRTASDGLSIGDASGAWCTGDPADADGGELRDWELDLSQWDSFPFLSPRIFATE